MSTSDDRATRLTFHTDQCLADVRTYGFCEHETLPRTATHPQPSPSRPQTWQRELVSTVAFLTVGASTITLLLKHGWPAFLLGIAIGLGWTVIASIGVPRWLMTDLSKALPSDAREKLGL